MHVSRPLVGLLVGTVLFFALWLVALKPGSPTSPGGSQGLGQYQSAIDKAHAAVNLANATSAAQGGAGASPQPGTTAKPGTSSPGKTPTAVKPAAVVVKPATPTPVRPAPVTSTSRLQMVQQALRSGKVLALLFYNGAAADDRAVKSELAAVPKHGRSVVTLAIPISELARYTVVTNQVEIGISPTLVIIDRRHQAVTITGFADRFEIAQRIADALAVK
jgi:hypothetical protein